MLWDKMRCHMLLAVGFLVQLAQGAQPSAPKPIPAPMRDLPWGQLNFLATTDTHGWHGGHLQEAQYCGDWGDYISFATRMREQADERGVDLLIVDTGDKVDGNGLYDGSNPKGKYTYNIFKQQHIDMLCTGNHELYVAEVTDKEYTETVPNSNGKYLASNVDIVDPKSKNRVPLAQRYRKFTTKHLGVRVLAFGFLFDFTGNANNSFVQRVEDTIKEGWFQAAIREDVDLFVIIGHVDIRSPEYKAIYTAIRTQKWSTPIQFFGGHSHIRNFVRYDASAYALESGRYMETIGWMTIDGIAIGGKESPKNMSSKATPTFERRYIDNNLFGYHYHTGLNESTFPTKLGKQVSETIQKARMDLDLDERIACAPQDYFLNRAKYPSNGSVLSLIGQEILPGILVGENRTAVPRIAIVNSGCIRFDIFQGPFTKDTVLIISPFNNKFQFIKDVPYLAAKGLLALLNSGSPIFKTASLEPGLLAPPEQIGLEGDNLQGGLDEFRQRFKIGQSPLGLSDSDKPDLIPGYTTKDDAGGDGDDTIHSPISFYQVPNCIQSQIAFPAEGDPEKVDLIFLDFIQPYILLGLRFLGQQHNASDVLPYIGNQSFTSLMDGWIKEHWSNDC